MQRWGTTRSSSAGVGALRGGGHNISCITMFAGRFLFFYINMVLYTKRNGNLSYVEQLANVMAVKKGMPYELAALMIIELRGDLVVYTAEGDGSEAKNIVKYVRFEQCCRPTIKLIDSARGLKFIQVDFLKYDKETGDVYEIGTNYFPIELIEKIEIVFGA